MRQLDELKYLVFGEDYIINDKLRIHNPTIGEIAAFGEFNYMALINSVVMRPYDDMVNLWEQGIDYETVTDYDLFIRNMKSPEMVPKMTEILFPSIDFRKFEVTINPQNDEVVLFDGKCIIDKNIYYQIVDFVRFIHYIDSEIVNEIKPGSESVKKYLIKRMKKKQEFNAKKPLKQNIANIASALCNTENTAIGYDNIKDCHISQMYDSFYRVLKRDACKNINHAIYGGVVSSKDIDSSSLEWYGSIAKQNNKEKER